MDQYAVTPTAVRFLHSGLGLYALCLDYVVHQKSLVTGNIFTGTAMAGSVSSLSLSKVIVVLAFHWFSFPCKL